jgi:hypothetical protein
MAVLKVHGSPVIILNILGVFQIDRLNFLSKLCHVHGGFHQTRRSGRAFQREWLTGPCNNTSIRDRYRRCCVHRPRPVPIVFVLDGNFWCPRTSCVLLGAQYQRIAIGETDPPTPTAAATAVRLRIANQGDSGGCFQGSPSRFERCRWQEFRAFLMYRNIQWRPVLSCAVLCFGVLCFAVTLNKGRNWANQVRELLPGASTAFDGRTL